VHSQNFYVGFFAEWDTSQIGYGDIVPATHLGRSLIIPYAIAGIIMLGLVAGSVGSLVLDRASQKMNARLTIRERERLESNLSNPHADDASDREKERREFNTMRRIRKLTREQEISYSRKSREQ
jgi:potassium channel subfamily K, other eukaryote